MRLRGQIKDVIERNADECAFSCEEKALVTLAEKDKPSFLHVGKVLASRAQQAETSVAPQSE